jgi:two-component system, NtrC family, response regulator GlrR
VDALPLAAQVKLLRLLQDKEFRPLGSQKVQKAEVRIIAATNTDIHARMSKGLFREDLFYRLNVLSLQLPPLRERKEDIGALAWHFLANLCARSADAPKNISPAALQRLHAYAWPGNVRELENVLEGSAVFCSGGRIESSDIRLPQAPAAREDESFHAQKARMIAQFEEGYIRAMLAANQNNITKAARAAGKDRRSFWELMRKYDLHHLAPHTSSSPAAN